LCHAPAVRAPHTDDQKKMDERDKKKTEEEGPIQSEEKEDEPKAREEARPSPRANEKENPSNKGISHGAGRLSWGGGAEWFWAIRFANRGMDFLF